MGEIVLPPISSLANIRDEYKVLKEKQARKKQTEKQRLVEIEVFSLEEDGVACFKAYKSISLEKALKELLRFFKDIGEEKNRIFMVTIKLWHGAVMEEENVGKN